ncbi:RNA polymerase sigma-70 factor (ECF subfamily) [Arcicella aurantiaca]|uniref:RNA polymerase sigma factor n=1 Tax=Arcicella aurantiaca TaxID=591202 RepID=A0A316ECJ3_9BACT|nr:sigma-70 family RNA polymerase sigma factor [Arcicella aurantiaca]PWK26493.1 RNA polymerase sigma-70 factor (ECF subfamily) [Arcicella aurantiaca]
MTEKQLTDSEILAKFAVTETRNFAFNQLVRIYQQKLYWHIRKMVIDHDDADDLTQETFIKAWKGLENFKGESQLFTWLYRIATNECLNHLAKKKRRFFLPINDITEELSNKLEDSDMISGDEIQLKLQKALLTLPDKQRLVFNMKYYDEMKYEEIAEITGTSVGALKASYHLAVKKVEEHLKNSSF